MAKTNRPPALDPEAWKKKAQEIQARVAAKDKARAEAKQKETEASNKAYRDRLAKETVKTNPNRNIPRTDYIGYTPSGAAEERARKTIEAEERQKRENLKTARQMARDRGYTKNPAAAGASSYRGYSLRELAQEEHDDFAEAAEYARNLAENHKRSAAEQKAAEFHAADVEDMSKRKTKWAIEDAEQMAPKVLDVNLEDPGPIDQTEIDSALKASDEHFAKKQSLIQKGRERAREFAKEARDNAVKASPNAVLAKDRRDRAIAALVKEAESYGYKGSNLADKAGAAYDKALAANGGYSEKARTSVRDTLLQNANKKYMAAAGERMNADQKAREDAIRNNPNAAKRREALIRSWNGAGMPSEKQVAVQQRWNQERKALSGSLGQRGAASLMKGYEGSDQHIAATATEMNRLYGGRANDVAGNGSWTHQFNQSLKFQQDMADAEKRRIEAQTAEANARALQTSGIAVSNGTVTPEVAGASIQQNQNKTQLAGA